MAERTVEQTNLHRLNAIRLTILLMELTGLAIASWFSVIQVDWSVLSIIAATTGLLVFYTHYRKQLVSDISESSLFKQLLADVFLQTLLLYWSGGYTNPFIFSYLVTVTISASVLSVRQRWFITTLTIVCYTLLQRWYQPLIPDHSAHGAMHSMIILHLGGMWMTFSISACLVTGVVAGMADAIRSHRAEINASREQRLRDERILAVATTAAGAAHELATPLSTMSVLLGEMSSECSDTAMSEDINLLQTQVGLCKKRLDNIVLASRNQAIVAKPVADVVEELLNEWQLFRPEANIQYTSSETPDCLIEADQSLIMAMINLLDNSADASPDFIGLKVMRNENRVVLQIEDHGRGVLSKVASQPGATDLTTKKEGHGLGLQLSVATVERLSGHVRLYTGSAGGTITEVSLPEVSMDE
ncbi:ATP-binding protein [Endozoicomonas sp. OPT23]|uniref:ATP-binding protein n=1 Tax=Endozoicomonas sp. OPT23 TaxID=2072845 RepID=UPI001890F163|nr:ATP-binding protein [Endozoicomonas sp. OPT23]